MKQNSHTVTTAQTTNTVLIVQNKESAPKKAVRRVKKQAVFIAEKGRETVAEQKTIRRISTKQVLMVFPQWAGAPVVDVLRTPVFRPVGEKVKAVQTAKRPRQPEIPQLKIAKDTLLNSDIFENRETIEGRENVEGVAKKRKVEKNLKCAEMRVPAKGAVVKKEVAPKKPTVKKPTVKKEMTVVSEKVTKATTEAVVELHTAKGSRNKRSLTKTVRRCSKKEAVICHTE